MPAPWLAPIVGGGISLAGSIIGGNKAASAASAQAEKANEAAIRQYGYDLQLWDLNKEMIKANRNQAIEEIAARARNEGREVEYRDAMNKLNYEYQLQIRDRQQASNEAQYKRSENIYSSQLSLNQMSEQTARDNEYRQLEEIHTEQAFDRNQAHLDSLAMEGKLRARGVTGRSAMKGYQVTAADFGRQISQLNEAFSSAGRNTRAVLKEISTDRASADLAANAQRMLDPGILPQPIQPLATPRTEWVMPRALGEFDFGPKPVLGAMADPAAAAGRVWGSTISSIAGTLGSTTAAVIETM